MFTFHKTFPKSIIILQKSYITSLAFKAKMEIPSNSTLFWYFDREVISNSQVNWKEKYQQFITYQWAALTNYNIGWDPKDNKVASVICNFLCLSTIRV